MTGVNVEKSHCRFCAENKPENELYILPRNEELNNRVTKIIESLKIDFIDFSNTKLPKCVCRGCYAFLETADDFVTKAKDSQPQLCAIYEKENIPEITVEVKTEPYDINALEVSDESDDEGPIINAVVDNTTINELQIVPEPPTPDVVVFSWKSYKWKCLHCTMSFDTMSDLRIHSKFEHKKCYGFECADCNEKQNHFSAFIEHVREHRPELREFCPYCNKKFDDPAQCMAHIPEHGIGDTTCMYCGEIFASIDLYENHKSIYKILQLPLQLTLAIQPPKKRKEEPKYLIKRGWMRYKWCCRECCESFNGVVPLRAHVQNEHKKCFAMKCMDCNRSSQNFMKFVEHVYSHQPFLKEFCQYCNKHFKKDRKLQAHIQEHLSGPQKPCIGCGQIFETNSQLKKHIEDFNAPAIKPQSVQDTTCDYCGKVLSSFRRLKSHMLTHIPDRPRNYICDLCNKGFQSKENLRCHKKTHGTRGHVCQVCNASFTLKTTLNAHVKIHNGKIFECDHCGKKFPSKERLKPHLKSHGEKEFACETCPMMFRYNYLLEAHRRQHTDIRPFNCGLCTRRFTIRPLLNKHMTFVHRVTLAEYESAISTDDNKIKVNETGLVIVTNEK